MENKLKYKKWILATLKAAWHRTATVNLIVTRRCDMNCNYCYSVREQKEIPPQDWIKIAKKLSKRFAVFTLSGGEPLLYDGVFDLINSLSEFSIAALCTNAKKIEESHLKVMRGLDYLNFSFDHTGDSNISTKTSFGKIPLLKEYSRLNSFELSATLVISNQNIESIPRVIEELKIHNIGINLQLVQRPQPIDTFDTPEKILKLEQLQNELLRMKHQGYPIKEFDDYIKGFVPFVKNQNSVHCLAGKVYFAVDSDGRFMPCQDTEAFGKPILEIEDIDSALKDLSNHTHKNCSCWWNCYYNYQKWAKNPLKYLLFHYR
jgi:MoaA/NifB/PqqE/SkfB family radical SAM enzyme